MSSILRGKYYAMYKLGMYKRNVCAIEPYLYFVPL